MRDGSVLVDFVAGHSHAGAVTCTMGLKRRNITFTERIKTNAAAGDSAAQVPRRFLAWAQDGQYYMFRLYKAGACPSLAWGKLLVVSAAAPRDYMTAPR